MEPNADKAQVMMFHINSLTKSYFHLNPYRMKTCYETAEEADQFRRDVFPKLAKEVLPKSSGISMIGSFLLELQLKFLLLDDEVKHPRGHNLENLFNHLNDELKNRIKESFKLECGEELELFLEKHKRPLRRLL